MSDELINKYRPKSFDEVIGQASVVKSLRNSIKKCFSHAVIFAGPSGCGKTTLARLTAAAVGCADFHIIEIDGVSETGIDNMRAVRIPTSIQTGCTRYDLKPVSTRNSRPVFSKSPGYSTGGHSQHVSAPLGIPADAW